MSRDVLGDDQLRALGRVAVAAAQAEWAIAVLVFGREFTLQKAVRSGAARKRLRRLSQDHPVLVPLEQDVTDLFERRNRLMHDVILEEFAEDDGRLALKPVHVDFRDASWKCRAVLSAAEVNELAEAFDAISSRCRRVNEL